MVIPVFIFSQKLSQIQYLSRILSEFRPARGTPHP